MRGLANIVALSALISLLFSAGLSAARPDLLSLAAPLVCPKDTVSAADSGLRQVPTRVPVQLLCVDALGTEDRTAHALALAFTFLLLPTLLLLGGAAMMLRWRMAQANMSLPWSGVVFSLLVVLLAMGGWFARFNTDASRMLKGQHAAAALSTIETELGTPLVALAIDVRRDEVRVVAQRSNEPPAHERLVVDEEGITARRVDSIRYTNLSFTTDDFNWADIPYIAERALVHAKVEQGFVERLHITRPRRHRDASEVEIQVEIVGHLEPEKYDYDEHPEGSVARFVVQDERTLTADPVEIVVVTDAQGNLLRRHRG